MKDNKSENTKIKDTRDYDDEISIVELFNVLRANARSIIIFTLLGAVLLLGYAYLLVDPTYQSTAKLYIVSTSNDSVVDLSDLNIGTSLTKDYEELILSYTVLDEVIDDLKLDMEFEDLSKMITLTNPTDTRVLNITVTTTGKALSRDIANDLAKVTCRYLPETMSTNPPNIAQKARLAKQKSAPSLSKYTIIGALIGFILSCLYFILLFMMDDTIGSAEDMEKYFGLTPLTTIPRSDKLNEGKSKKGSKNGKSKKDREGDR